MIQKKPFLSSAGIFYLSHFHVSPQMRYKERLIPEPAFFYLSLHPAQSDGIVCFSGIVFPIPNHFETGCSQKSRVPHHDESRHFLLTLRILNSGRRGDLQNSSTIAGDCFRRFTPRKDRLWTFGTVPFAVS